MQTQDEIDQRIGATIRRLRGERGATQAQVAAAAGLTFQQVQKYERGVNRVAISTLVPMCKALGCSPAEFVAEAMDDPSAGTAPGADELHRLYAALHPGQRAVLLQVAGAMVPQTIQAAA